MPTPRPRPWRLRRPPTAARAILERSNGRLRRKNDLFGLPGGTKKHWRHFYPAFQIDAERCEIYPKMLELNRVAGREPRL